MNKAKKLFCMLLILTLTPLVCFASAGAQAQEISGTLEIQYFVGGSGDLAWKEAIRTFQEKYPNVEVVEYAGSTVNETMKPRWISDNPPDVVYIDGAGSSETQMVEDGQLMDLSEWWQTLTLEDGTPLSEAFLVPPSVWDGKVYTLPLIFDNRGIWYDIAWFEENGWEVPTDYDSWMASMEIIRNETGIAPIATTGVYPAVFMKGVLYPALASEGGLDFLMSLIDGEEGTWASEQTLTVAKRIEAMVTNGYIDPDFAALTHTEAQMNFLNHLNAYVPVGFWLPQEMAGSIPEDFEFGIIPTPMNTADSVKAIIPDIHPIGIAAKAKNPEAAKAFVEHLLSVEMANVFAEMNRVMYNLRDFGLDENPNVPQYLKNASQLISAEDVVMMPLEHAMASELESMVGNLLVSMLMGDITAEEFCAQAEESAATYRANR